MTKKVKLNTSIASPAWCYEGNREMIVGVDIPQELADEFVSKGIAEFVGEAPALERAVAKHEGAERAVKHAPRRQAPKGGA